MGGNVEQYTSGANNYPSFHVTQTNIFVLLWHAKNVYFSRGHKGKLALRKINVRNFVSRIFKLGG